MKYFNPIANPEHIHHSLWLSHIQGVISGDPKNVEIFDGGVWAPIKNAPNGFSQCDWFSNRVYRLSTPKVSRSLCYPAPLKESPKEGDVVWSIVPVLEDNVLDFKWDSEISYHREILKKGYVWSCEEDAREAAKEIFGIFENKFF